jgi:hypothetical protein
MALKSPLTGDNLDYQRENAVKMISAADIAAIVTHATTVYTSQEIHEKIQKEERECACRRSRWHRDRYQHDGEVSWEAFLYRREMTGVFGPYGLYVRAERACGMVLYWGETWIPSPFSDKFWSTLYARVEDQCDSIRFAPDASAPSSPEAEEAAAE